MALLYFKSAVAVNPRSSVLRCYWGMTLAKQGILGSALTRLQVRMPGCSELGPCTQSCRVACTAQGTCGALAYR